MIKKERNRSILHYQLCARYVKTWKRMTAALVGSSGKHGRCMALNSVCNFTNFLIRFSYSKITYNSYKGYSH